MILHVIAEANRCFECKKPMCQLNGCPIHTPIPQMIHLLKEGKLREAGDMLFANNPLSVVCSIVCNHQKQCEGNCIQGKKGQPIHISSIENYISDTCLDQIKIDIPEWNGKRMAIIGAGPAGITVAIEMAKRGYKVTIFDAKDKIGGIMQYGIPAFRLPKSILERYGKLLRDIGIMIRPNTTIGGALEIKDLFRDGYSAIFIGTGVWRPKKLGIKGESVGIPEEQLRKAAKSAVCKINIDSDGRLAMTGTIRRIFDEKPAEFDPRKYLGPARDALKEMYMHKNIDVLGSAGHALD